MDVVLQTKKASPIERESVVFELGTLAAALGEIVAAHRLGGLREAAC